MTSEHVTIVIPAYNESCNIGILIPRILAILPRSTIIVVDDSIVRGTTIKKIIEILKKCGAEKIHIRVCSPPIKYSCYYGVDTPDPNRLIANKKSIEEFEKLKKEKN